MPAMRDVEWLPPLLEVRRDRAREARIRAEFGRFEEAFRYFMASDWVPEATTALNLVLFTRTHLDHDLADIVGLAVSQQNSCRYCFAATRVLLLLVGFPRPRIARLEQNLAIADLDDRTQAAIAFARRLSRADPQPAAADVAALAAVGIAGPAYRELAATVALWVFLNRVSTLPALPPEAEEAQPDRWVMRAIPPFIGRWLTRSLRRRGAPVALPADMRDGPCADVVNALDGLPVAPALRRAVDAMWASDGLPRRTRALICLTIACALGCADSVDEAIAMLGAAGVDDATVRETVAHLDAPGLTETERVLVRFARSTVWYEPAAVQRGARDVRERLPERDFVEAIGTAALANALCRLRLALHAA